MQARSRRRRSCAHMNIFFEMTLTTGTVESAPGITAPRTSSPRLKNSHRAHRSEPLGQDSAKILAAYEEPTWEEEWQKDVGDLLEWAKRWNSDEGSVFAFFIALAHNSEQEHHPHGPNPSPTHRRLVHGWGACGESLGSIYAGGVSLALTLFILYLFTFFKLEYACTWSGGWGNTGERVGSTGNPRDTHIQRFSAETLRRGDGQAVVQCCAHRTGPNADGGPT